MLYISLKVARCLNTWQGSLTRGGCLARLGVWGIGSGGVVWRWGVGVGGESGVAAGTFCFLKNSLLAFGLFIRVWRVTPKWEWIH